MVDLRRAAGEKIEVYQLSGSSDCVLVSNDADAFRQLLGTALVEDDKSGGRPIRNLVVSTEATLLRPICLPDALPQETVAKIKPSDRVDGQIRQLREILVESMPLITQMLEMSLFDCGGTVLRMTRECMHYCGERLRRPRVTYMIDFTARCFATEFARFLFSEEGYPKHILAEMKDKFLLDGPEFSEAVFQAWKDSAQNLREKIAVRLAGQLKMCYDAEREGWNERYHMSDNLRQWILDKMIPLFSPYHCEEDIVEALENR